MSGLGVKVMNNMDGLLASESVFDLSVGVVAI